MKYVISTIVAGILFIATFVAGLITGGIIIKYADMKEKKENEA